MSDKIADELPAAGQVRPDFDSGGPSLLWLAMRMSVLTILTLGLYRFWMTTRLRRYYWNAIRVMGDPFEYTGTALEKFLGFLLALVILAVYLSIVNLALAFIGLVSFEEPSGYEIQIIINLSILASLPLIYFATYRARRYILARTRWRGIRFGMDQAAWAYTCRALLWIFVSAVTLGLLYPLQNFRLTKFKIDRTWFGDVQFQQHGRWQDLMGYWAWVWLTGALIFGGVVVLSLNPSEENAAMTGLLVLVGYIAVGLIMVRYRVAAFRYFWENRTVGGARFSSDLSASEIIGIYIVGGIGVGVSAFLLALAIVFLVTFVWYAFASPEQVDALRRFAQGDADPSLAWPIFAIIAVGYLAVIAFSSALAHVFITRPVLRRQAENMRINGAYALAETRQRAHDDAVEAGGFADALGVDVGAGF